MSDDSDPMSLPPLSIEVGGILEGRVLDRDGLLAATGELSRRGLGTFQCEVTGGRFSLLPMETRVRSGSFGVPEQEEFLRALSLLTECAVPGSVESTLRCRLIFAADVVETLFLPKGGKVEVVSRTRPRTSEDRAAADAESMPAQPKLRRRDIAVIAVALFLLGGLLIWRTGLLERVLAARAERIAVSTGPFHSMLDVTSKLRWGTYETRITRGAGYPNSPQELSRLSDQAASLADRAACTAVGNGGEVWILLRDHDGHVLEARSVSLAGLLRDDKAFVDVDISGHMAAAELYLSLSREGASGSR